MILFSEVQVFEVFKVVKDFEILVNVVDFGLIYGVDILEDGNVDIIMILISVGCLVQDFICVDVEMVVGCLDGVEGVNVEFVWMLFWGFDKMIEDGKCQMWMFGFNV